MIRFVVGLCVFVSFVGMSQETSLNAYKYIVVPTSFNTFGEPDAYQMNSLTKFLFEKYGFSTVYENGEYPDDLAVNNCLGLKVDLVESSTLIRTKLQVVLSDCRNNTVYISPEGESKSKDLKAAYQSTLRETFKSLELLKYQYQPGTVEAPEMVNESTPNIPIAEPTKKEPMIDSDPQPILEKARNSEEEIGFKLIVEENGFSLINVLSAERIGTGFKTAKEGTYLYSSKAAKGLAYFLSTQELVVEYVSENGVVERIVFQLQ